MTQIIDKSIERTLYYRETTAPPRNCPQCGQALVQAYGPYQIATRQGQQLTDMLMISGDFGYLCAGCPTAVVHVPTLAEMLYDMPPKPGWRIGPEFAVIGLLNLDAIPDDQKHVPLDKLDDYPLVLFHVATTPKKRPLRRRKPKPKRRK